jgi:23S rRNA pseudouridine2605 synthase
LITQGRVEVNGHVVTELGAKADPERDHIKVDGRRLKAAPSKRYLLMNKPAGVVSTRSDPQRRRTVIDVLEARGIRGYFYPVGRLDYDSEGLIILTNDGAFAEKVSHPRNEARAHLRSTCRGRARRPRFGIGCGAASHSTASGHSRPPSGFAASCRGSGARRP